MFFEDRLGRHPSFARKLDILLTWSVTSLQYGDHRPYAAACILEEWRRKAGERAPLSVMASDAYFPFPDGIQIAAQAGVTAIIQPGGSIRDEMAIEVADRHHMAMVFTGRRHFKH